MTTVTYQGRRFPTGCRVQCLGPGTTELLPLRLDLCNHSPTGFEWGYAGSGPAQLALAILADALGDDRRALRLHQQFKAAYIQNLDRDEDADWSIDAGEVRRWATTVTSFVDDAAE
jgi:hypothetical protein